MPRVWLPLQNSIARMAADNIAETSLEERPPRKIFWSDEFDSLIDLPINDAQQSVLQEQLCRMPTNIMTDTDYDNHFEGSIPLIGQRAALLSDDCFVHGFSEGLGNVLVVAFLLLLVDVALIAICLRFRLWRLALYTRRDRLTAGPSVDEPDVKMEV